MLRYVMIWFGLVKESEGEIQRMAETNYHAEHICAEALVSALAPAAQPLLSLRSYSIQYITSAAVGFFSSIPGTRTTTVVVIVVIYQ